MLCLRVFLIVIFFLIISLSFSFLRLSGVLLLSPEFVVVATVHFHIHPFVGNTNKFYEWQHWFALPFLSDAVSVIKINTCTPFSRLLRYPREEMGPSYSKTEHGTDSRKVNSPNKTIDNITQIARNILTARSIGRLNAHIISIFLLKGNVRY